METQNAFIESAIQYITGFEWLLTCLGVFFTYWFFWTKHQAGKEADMRNKEQRRMTKHEKKEVWLDYYDLHDQYFYFCIGFSVAMSWTIELAWNPLNPKFKGIPIIFGL